MVGARKKRAAATSAAVWNRKNFPKSGLWEAASLSRELRFGSGGFLEQRRAIVGLSLVAIGAMGLISLYQMGVVKHLPSPPLPRMDSDGVDGSTEAYKRFSTPDAVLGLGSYAATMALAEMGAKNRAREHPWMALAMGGKILFDIGQALRMVRQQWKTQKAFCFWCLITAAATFASAACAVGETGAAARRLLRGR